MNKKLFSIIFLMNFFVSAAFGMHNILKYTMVFGSSLMSLKVLYSIDPNKQMEQLRESYLSLFNANIVEEAPEELQREINAIVPNIDVFIFSRKKYQALAEKYKNNLSELYQLVLMAPQSGTIRNPFTGKNAIMLEKEKLNDPQGEFVKQHELNHLRNKDHDWRVLFEIAMPLVTCLGELGLYKYGFAKQSKTLKRGFCLGLMHCAVVGLAGHFLARYQEIQADKVWTECAVDGGIEFFSNTSDQNFIARIFDPHPSNKSRLSRLKKWKKKLFTKE